MYADKNLTCADCSQEFVFTASEQDFYAQRGFTEPRRCASCRASRKAARNADGGGSSYGSYGAGGGYSAGGYSGGGGGGGGYRGGGCRRLGGGRRGCYEGRRGRGPGRRGGEEGVTTGGLARIGAGSRQQRNTHEDGGCSRHCPPVPLEALQSAYVQMVTLTCRRPSEPELDFALPPGRTNNERPNQPGEQPP